MDTGKRILIVEDDEAIATGLALNLRITGYEPELIQDGDEVLDAVERVQPHLILLDINLPRKDGLSLLTELREQGNRVPVIMLSARADEHDKVAALRLGADDYVTKPFALAELMARVDAVLRRFVGSPILPVSTAHGAANGTPAPEPAGQEMVEFGEITMDPSTRTVTRGGEVIKLTHLEFELLCFLATHPSQVFSRDELLREVWGQTRGSPRTVDNFVAQLRSKLESDPENPSHLVTVRGSGYRFDA